MVQFITSPVSLGGDRIDNHHNTTLTLEQNTTFEQDTTFGGNL